MLRAIVLTQYWRVTDGQTDARTDRQTDGIAIASTALAMRALRHTVEMLFLLWPPYGIGQAILFLSCGFFYR